MPRVSEDELAAKRARILAGARRAFARHGYQAATVKVLEAETGLSRGAIFHHFKDKDALFLALADHDAAQTAAVVAEHGLVQVMRELRDKDAGWFGVHLEVRRRLRTDPEFAALWASRTGDLSAATAARLERQQQAGVVRRDVPVPLLVDFLRLAFDGLIAGRAAGMPADHVDGVLDLVEDAVRTPRPLNPGPLNPGPLNPGPINQSPAHPPGSSMAQPTPPGSHPAAHSPAPPSSVTEDRYKEH